MPQKSSLEKHDYKKRIKDSERFDNHMNLDRIYLLMFLSALTPEAVKIKTKQDLLCWKGTICGLFSANHPALLNAFPDHGLEKLNDDVAIKLWNIWEGFRWLELGGDLAGKLYMMAQERSWRVKKNGQYFTPDDIADLITAMTKVKKGTNKIYDPAAGAGALLIAAWNKMRKDGVEAKDIIVHGQDIDAQITGLCAMQFILKSNYDFHDEFIGSLKRLEAMNSFDRKFAPLHELFSEMNS